MAVISEQAQRIANHLRRLGAAAKISHSTISESAYIDASTETRRVRIRGSNHVARPTYEALNGSADIEFGGHDMSHGDWLAALLAALEKLHLEPDATIRGLKTRSQNKNRKAAAEEAAKIEASDKNYNDHLAKEAAMIKWAGERWVIANDKSRSAKARKRARQALRAQYLAALK